MVMYMFFSLIATFITEGLIFMGIYLYETEIIAGEYKKVWGASGQGKMSFGTFTLSQSIALDVWVIAIFTILLLIIYFILAKRRRLLDYLKAKDITRYRAIVKELGLRK